MRLNKVAKILVYYILKSFDIYLFMLRGVEANVLDCYSVVIEFELQLYTLSEQCSCERYEPLISPVIGWILSLLYFYKNGFGIK